MPNRRLNNPIRGDLYTPWFLYGQPVAANANNVQEEKNSAHEILQRAKQITQDIKTSNKSMSRDLVESLAPEYKALCNLKGTIQVAFNKQNYTEITSQHSSALDRAKSAYDNSFYETSMDQARAHAESYAEAETANAGWDEVPGAVAVGWDAVPEAGAGGWGAVPEAEANAGGWGASAEAAASGLSVSNWGEGYMPGDLTDPNNSKDLAIKFADEVNKMMSIVSGVEGLHGISQRLWEIYLNIQEPLGQEKYVDVLRYQGEYDSMLLDFVAAGEKDTQENEFGHGV